MVYCLFPNSKRWMYVCARIDNGLVEESEELAGEAPEQQLVGGGKYPLTHQWACLVQLFSDQLFWESGYGENLVVERIWVSWGLRAENDELVQRVQNLESDGFLGKHGCASFSLFTLRNCICATILMSLCLKISMLGLVRLALNPCGLGGIGWVWIPNKSNFLRIFSNPIQSMCIGNNRTRPKRWNVPIAVLWLSSHFCRRHDVASGVTNV